jgi:AraC-like DNA-binding protein
MTWQPPRFDLYQFARGSRPDFAGGGIDIRDVTRAVGSLHIDRRPLQQERRLETPPWVNNNELLREEVLKACEKRLYLDERCRAYIPGQTHQERFARIRQTERMDLKRWLETLRKLRERYRTEPKETRPEEIQLHNVDTFCCLLKRGSVAITVAVVHLYYRLGYNSVEVARELHLKPPHVRQILARLLHSARGVSQIKWATPPRSGPDFDLMMQWHREGMPLDELTLRLRLLGYTPLKVSTVYRALESTKLAHFEKLQEQVAEVEAIFACIPRIRKRPRWNKERMAFIHSCRSNGMTWREIAPKTGYKDPGQLAHAYKFFLKHPHDLEESKGSISYITKRANARPEVQAARSAGVKASWVTRRTTGKATWRWKHKRVVTQEYREAMRAVMLASWARRKRKVA